MPVHLEHVTQPSEQDWIDLGKIYSDAPQEWLNDHSDIKGSLQSLLDQGTWFISGRFNARLLGAMKADKQGNEITLSHFCVRNITTNRGVAHQMLHHMSTWADDNGYKLVAIDVPKDLSAPLIKRGFIAESDSFIRNPK